MGSHDGRRNTLFRLFALLLVLAMVGVACGGGDDDDGDAGGQPQQDEGDPQPGGSITVGLEAETNSFLPGEGVWSNAGTLVALHIFDPLMTRNEDGEMQPYLAESVEPNDDLTEWTMKLREGVTFHDGTPFNADAVKYTFDKLLFVPESVVYGTYTNTFKVRELQKVDDLTVKFLLEEGNAAFPDALDFTPFSPTAHQADPENAGSKPVGTGPFKFVSWERDNRLVVQKNADYWRQDDDGNQLPYLDEIVFRPIPDEDTRLQSVINADIHAMQALRQSSIAQARDAGDRLRRFEDIGNNGGGGIFNVQRAPVDDARVRVGLTWALDQNSLIEVLGGTDITPPMTQYVADDSPWYSEDVADAWPSNDPERARELLDEYVNDPERSDGKNPGDPISVEFNCPPDPSLIEYSQAVQQMWQTVGVEVKLNQVEQAAHIQNAIKNDYMINCWRMGFGQDDPYTALSAAFGPPDSTPLNFTNFHDDFTWSRIQQLRTETDLETRKGLVEEIMMHFTEQVPNYWTGATPTVFATVPALKNPVGWTLPGGDLGDGVTQAVTFLTEAWLER